MGRVVVAVVVVKELQKNSSTHGLSRGYYDGMHSSGIRLLLLQRIVNTFLAMQCAKACSVVCSG